MPFPTQFEFEFVRRKSRGTGVALFFSVAVVVLGAALAAGTGAAAAVTATAADAPPPMPPNLLMYSVNPAEGFNLRRDLLLRMMLIVRKLNDEAGRARSNERAGPEWGLVLPPFPDYVPHWPYRSPSDPAPVWDMFFDWPRLSDYVPVFQQADLEARLADGGRRGAEGVAAADGQARTGALAEHEWEVAEVFHLRQKPFDANRPRQYPADEVDCGPAGPLFPYRERGSSGAFEPDDTNAGFTRWWTRGVRCLEIFMPISKMAVLLRQSAAQWNPRAGTRLAMSGMQIDLGDDARASELNLSSAEPAAPGAGGGLHTVLLQRAEHLFWDSTFGSAEFWRAEAALEFAPRLRAEAERFAAQEDLVPGRYLGVHFRRGDFRRMPSKDTPEVDAAALQLLGLMVRDGVLRIFVSTDADAAERDRLRSLVPGLVFYEPRADGRFHAGEVSIVEQLLASAGKGFVGTCTSTFSSTIIRRRERLRYPAALTYRCLCREPGFTCEQPGRHAFVE